MPRYFSLDEANRTLPLVRRIVADITGLHPTWRDLVYRFELVTADSRPEWGESTESLALRAQIEEVARRINDYVRELEQIGCELKGFAEGLVDFHGTLEGREILWCWKQGEERIEHWHDLESGFAGRRPIPAVLTGGEGGETR